MKKNTRNFTIGLLVALAGWAICENVAGVNEWTATIFICPPLAIMSISLGNIFAEVCKRFGEKIAC